MSASPTGAAAPGGAASGRGTGAGTRCKNRNRGGFQGRGGNTSQQQAILHSDYTELVSQVLNFIQNAEYNGRNILQSGSANVNVISDTTGGAITVRAQNLEATAYSQLNVQIS